MDPFFRFPQIPHILWLGEGQPRDDKLLSPGEAAFLLENEVTVEEKVDGANLGISFDSNGEIQVQNRGQYLIPPFVGQFRKLGAWIAKHEDAFFDHLGSRFILFGEWCAARHSLAYKSLPDWFLAFDIYDKPNQRFWSTGRRDALVAAMRLPSVPTLFQGRVDMACLRGILDTSKSQYGSTPIEGLIIRNESREFLIERAKIVRANFIQSIEEHWRKRSLEWNSIH